MFYKQISQLSMIHVQSARFGVGNYILKTPGRIEGAGFAGCRKKRHNGIRKKGNALSSEHHLNRSLHGVGMEDFSGPEVVIIEYLPLQVVKRGKFLVENKGFPLQKLYIDPMYRERFRCRVVRRK